MPTSPSSASGGAFRAFILSSGARPVPDSPGALRLRSRARLDHRILPRPATCATSRRRSAVRRADRAPEPRHRHLRGDHQRPCGRRPRGDGTGPGLRAVGHGPTARPALLDIHGGGFVVGSSRWSTPSPPRSPATSMWSSSPPSTGWPPSTRFRLPPTTASPPCSGCTPTPGRSGSIPTGSPSAGTAPVVGWPRPSPSWPATRAARICFQFLGIPELDHRLETPSMQAFVDTPVLHRPDAELSWSYYLAPTSPRCGPTRRRPAIAPPDVSGLPPAYVTRWNSIRCATRASPMPCG